MVSGACPSRQVRVHKFVLMCEEMEATLDWRNVTRRLLIPNIVMGSIQK